MIQQHPAALILDFDGLMMDTETTSLRSWEWEWRQWGLVLKRETFFVQHGGDVTEDRYAALAQAVGPSYDRESSHGRRSAYRDHIHESLPLLSGVDEWLEQASSSGLPVAVASSSPKDWVTRHLKAVGALTRIDVLATGDEVDKPKPDPAVYRLALKRLQMSPNDVLAVEDSPHGVAAAQAAGLKCLAVPTTWVDPTAVAHADLVLESLAISSLAAAWAQLR